MAAAIAKITETTAVKAAAEQKLVPTTEALKVATDSLAASQVKLEASKNATMDLQKQADTLQADIARFNAFPVELATKKTSIEQALTTVQAQLQPVEAMIATSKTQLDSVNGEVTKLEQQLAALQAMMVAEQAKRTSLQAEMAEKQKSLEAVRTQVQQGEADLGNIALQQQLFEQAYRKK
jgi:chromosome segregation ATPase